MSQTLTVTRRFSASAETVFDAWLNPAIARRFLFATPDGEMLRTDIEAKVGGRFNITERRPDMGDVTHVGEYLEIERPRRLVFTFAVPQFDPAYTTVAIDIAALAEGGCELTLTHGGVLEEWAKGTQEGWGKILDTLGDSL
jgi:uncharacterized protein YndB with AHSA1/START domain